MNLSGSRFPFGPWLVTNVVSAGRYFCLLKAGRKEILENRSKLEHLLALNEMGLWMNKSDLHQDVKQGHQNTRTKTFLWHACKKIAIQCFHLRFHWPYFQCLNQISQTLQRRKETLTCCTCLDKKVLFPKIATWMSRLLVGEILPEYYENKTNVELGLPKYCEQEGTPRNL